MSGPVVTAELWEYRPGEAPLRLAALPLAVSHDDRGLVHMRCEHYLGVVKAGVRHVWSISADGREIERRIVRCYDLKGGSGGGIARDLPCAAAYGLHTTAEDWEARLIGFRVTGVDPGDTFPERFVFDGLFDKPRPRN